MGADLHYMNDQALGLAAAAGHADVVDQLLALGAYIRADNDAALRLACNNRHTHVVSLLLSAGADAAAVDLTRITGTDGASQLLLQMLLDANHDAAVARARASAAFGAM